MMMDDDDVEERKSGASRPNILITGTPGTGKTTTAQLLAEAVGFRHVNVGEWVKTKQLHSGYMKEFDTFHLDEDKLLDEMEPHMSGAKGGGVVVDFHSSEFFPERWFQLVVVLRTDNDVLYPRLHARGYSKKKIAENIEAEIMQVCLDEARGAYDSNIVVELKSNTAEQMRSNVERIKQWTINWLKDNQNNDDDDDDDDDDN